MAETIDPLERRTKHIYDEQGRIISVTLPDNSKNTLEYDNRGNIIAITNNTGSKNAIRI